MAQIIRRSATEVATIVGVLVTIVGGMLVFAANATDRIALMEERIAVLQHDMNEIKDGGPFINARLAQQRAELDKLEHRLDVLQGRDND